MSEPISLFFVRDNSRDLAFSALPSAPVRTEPPARARARQVVSSVARRTVPRGARRLASPESRHAV
ncbi:MAG: hypothetical protein JJE52_05370 [Acidimicrobiia bacterium]|nr:hypothetical protein [Acidimicrobiia bacterium]